jgi:hypothetical protein
MSHPCGCDDLCQLTAIYIFLILLPLKVHRSKNWDKSPKIWNLRFTRPNTGTKKSFTSPNTGTLEVHPSKYCNILTFSVTEYTECQAFLPVVGTAGHPTPSSASECCAAPPPLGSKGGDTLACACGGGGGGPKLPNSDEGKGQTRCYSMYTIVPLRLLYRNPCAFLV